MRWVLLVAPLVVGCDALLDVGLPRDHTPDTGADAGHWPPYGEPACEQCVIASCAAEERACVADPKCADTYRCVANQKASNVEVRALCEVNLRDGADTEMFRALDACRRRACTETCLVGATDPKSCTGCCRAEEIACMSSPADATHRIGDCERALRCANAARDPVAAWVCAETLATLPMAGALLACRGSDTCKTLCNYPTRANLGCVGSFRWPRVAMPARAAIVLKDSKGGAVVGARVRACSKADCATCGAFIAEARTDGGGRAELTPSEPSFDGCFEVVADGFMTSLVYPGRPLVRNETFERTLMTVAELEALANEKKTTRDPKRGHLFFAAYDCRAVPAYGAQIVGSGSDAADLLNLSPGTHTLRVTAVVPGFGPPEPLGGLEVWVREDVITLVDVWPTPSP